MEDLSLFLKALHFAADKHRYQKRKGEDASPYIRVIVKSGVSASELGGDLVNCFHLDSIFEFHPGNHLRKRVEPTQTSPVFLGTHPQLEHHVQHAVTG